MDTHLLMDGVVDLYNLSTTKPMISRFRYYPNPIIHKFSGDENVFEYSTSAKEVEIKVRKFSTILFQTSFMLYVSFCLSDISILL